VLRIRLLLGLAVWVITGTWSWAQGGVFGEVKPDVTIRITKHPTGADMVEITMLNPKYPEELLSEQVAYLGREMGSEPRGLTVQKYQLSNDNPNLVFVKAMFAMDGLVDLQTPALRIKPILKAFTGVPEPLTIQGLSIFYENVQQNKAFVRTINNASAVAEAKAFSQVPRGIEYRIRLKATKPEEVEFPDRVDEPKPAPVPSESTSSFSVTGTIAIGVAAVAAGALVYLALLRRGNPNPKSPK
jgi:hypothetical protein